MTISIRELVKELLDNKYINVSYVEYPGDEGGFDLSVRVNKEELNRGLRGEPVIEPKE